MKKVYLPFLPALCIASILSSTLLAQQPTRSCTTVEYNKQKELSNPALAKARQEVNQLIERYRAEHSYQNTRSVITVPVVVHVIYDINLQNIPDYQIYSQIDVLNKDYAHMNSDTALAGPFSSVAANTGIQFCLATRDPNGNATTGIERRQNTGAPDWPPNDSVKAYVNGGLDGWPRTKYLNIWVCTLRDNYLGFTTLPGINDGDSIFDGCVITSRAFGDTGYVSPPFHLGRTATHEVGHWLGLSHIWGDDGGACPSDPGGNDDFMNDTPPQGSETTGCPSFPLYDNCSPTYPGIMFMNYMDYTNDACMNMFTQDQADKMNDVLNTVRANILTSDGCGFVGIPGVASNAEEISVYPNPANNELYVTGYTLFEKSTVEIYDMLGQCVLQPQTSNLKPQTIIDISSLDAGSYFLKITSANSVYTARFNIAR